MFDWQGSADVLLNETAISWLKAKLVKANVAVFRPWQETPEEFGSRLAAVVRQVNADCAVGDLCRGWRQRLHKLVAAEGDRLRH